MEYEEKQRKEEEQLIKLEEMIKAIRNREEEFTIDDHYSN